MYAINLIRERIVPVGRRRLGYMLLMAYGVLWVGALVVLGMVYMGSKGSYRVHSEALGKLESEVGAMVSDVPDRDELSRLRDRLYPRLIRLRGVVDGRMVWSRKLQELAVHMPVGLGLREVYVSSVEEEGESLVLSGRVLAEEGLGPGSGAEDLVVGLSGSTGFMDGLGGIEVLEDESGLFEVKCALKGGKKASGKGT